MTELAALARVSLQSSDAEDGSDEEPAGERTLANRSTFLLCAPLSLSTTNTCTSLSSTFMSLLHRQQQCRYSGPAVPQSSFGSCIESVAHSHSYHSCEEDKTKEGNRARFSSNLKTQYGKVCVLPQ